MDTLLRLKPLPTIFLFVFLDTLAIGMGMGVPIFPIGFGFLVGWYLAVRLAPDPRQLGEALPRILAWSGLTAGLTFLEMVVLWGPTVPMLFDSSADLANFGHPFILYEPRISFIGWIVLMILISPLLQLLTTVFSADVTHFVRLRRLRTTT